MTYILLEANIEHANKNIIINRNYVNINEMTILFIISLLIITNWKYYNGVMWLIRTFSK